MLDESQECRLWGKGSGSSGVLNKNALDQQDFVPLELGFSPQALDLAASFLLARSEQQELYVWGLVGSEKVARPMKVLQQVEQLSCGWYDQPYRGITP